MTTGWQFPKGEPGLVSEAVDEAKFFRWLSSVYGLNQALSWRLIHTGRDITGTPEYRQWAWAGYPETGTKAITAPEQPAGGLPSGAAPYQEPTQWPEPTPSPEVDHPEKVESRSGYDFLMKWDAVNKKYINIATLGKTPDTALGSRELDWRMSQAELARGERGQELAWKMSQAATERQDALWRAQQIAKYNVFQEVNLRHQRASQIREEDIRRQAQAEAASTFEQWRSTILSGIAPRDWVIREKAKAAGNPFEVQATDPARAIENLKQSAKQAQQSVANAKASYDAVSARVTDNATIVDNAELQVAKNRYEQAVAFRNSLEGELTNVEQWNVPGRLTKEGLPGWEGSRYVGVESPSAMAQIVAQQTPRDIGGGSFSYGGGAFGSIPVQKPYEPQVPEDIKRYLIGGTFGGAIQPPSGQSWSVAPYSTRERLYGYAESLGLNAADLEQRIQSMYPQTPVRGARWSPRR